MHRSTLLHENWSLKAGPQGHVVPDAVAGVELPARVPGNVHLDLLAAGLLEDPYFGRNELLVQWVGNAEWIYSTTFDAPHGEAEVHELVFEGLDCVARVELNGTLVGETFNQHRTYRFDVTTLLRASENSLVVKFGRVRDYALAHRYQLGDRPHNYPEPYNFVRKSAANFGWDWGPNLVTAGIWKPVRLESWTSARLQSVRPHLTLSEGSGAGIVEIDVEVQQRSRAAGTNIEVSIGSSVRTFAVTGQPKDRLRVEVPDPALWWPRGLGEPHMYDLRLRLLDADGAVLDNWTKRVGFRTAELRTQEDAAGRAYTLAVNGVEIFVRGANWIPDDCFVGGIDRERYAERIQQALEANMNLLRVWGGGVYEKDEFYELCDEAGLLVSQDFLFACGAYPEEEPLHTEVELEARDNIGRIMTHPSMVLWNGSNENIWGYFDWGWKEELGNRSWGLGYYLDLLPSLVSELDPTTPYWASSPYSGSMDLHPNESSHGNQHLWDVWNRIDYTHYADSEPRFVSEFGFQGPPNWATIRESVADDPLDPEGVELLHHQKASDGNGKLARGMAPHLPDPNGFDEWHFMTQLNQARAVAFGVEYFRSLRPHCMGAIVWQLNDCWPVTSWAAVDGHGRRKPLWYELRRVFADRLITIQPANESGLEAVLVNDGAEGWTDRLVLSRVAVDGRTATAYQLDVDVPMRSVIRVPIPQAIASSETPSEEGVVAEAGGLRAIRFFREDRDMSFPRAAYSVDTKDVVGGVELTVHARSLVRDLVLSVDRVDPHAETDDQVVTLLPGESRTFRVSTAMPAGDRGWKDSTTVRAVNDSKHYQW